MKKMFGGLKNKIDKNYQQIVKLVYQDDVKDNFKRQLYMTKDQFSDLYYSQRALFNNASASLPYQSLVVLGKMLSHPVHKNTVRKIIQDNMFKSQGHFFKLDDPYQQSKIRKLLSTFQFELCHQCETKIAA